MVYWNGNPQRGKKGIYKYKPKRDSYSKFKELPPVSKKKDNCRF